MGSRAIRLNAIAIISKGYFKIYLIRYTVLWNLLSVSDHDKLLSGKGHDRIT